MNGLEHLQNIIEALASPTEAQRQAGIAELNSLCNKPRPALLELVLTSLTVSNNDNVLVLTCNIIERVWIGDGDYEMYMHPDYSRFLETIFARITNKDNHLSPVALRKLLYLYANILKFSWQDDRIKQTMECLISLLASSPDLCTIGLRVLRVILQEFSFKKVNETMTTNRKLVISLKQHGLTAIFQNSFMLLCRLAKGETSIEDARTRFKLTRHALGLLDESLTFTDYLHSQRNDNSTIVVPDEWVKMMFPPEDPSFAIRLFTDTYLQLSAFPKHANLVLSILISLISISKTCFSSEQVFTIQRRSGMSSVVCVCNSLNDNSLGNLYNICRYVKVMKNMVSMKIMMGDDLGSTMSDSSHSPIMRNNTNGNMINNSLGTPDNGALWTATIKAIRELTSRVIKMSVGSAMETQEIRESLSMLLLFWYAFNTGLSCVSPINELRINEASHECGEVWKEIVGALIDSVGVDLSDHDNFGNECSINDTEQGYVCLGNIRISSRDVTSIGILAKSLNIDESTNLLTTSFDREMAILKNNYDNIMNGVDINTLMRSELRCATLIYVSTWAMKNRTSFAYGEQDAKIIARIFTISQYIMSQQVQNIASTDGRCSRGTLRILLASILTAFKNYSCSHIRGGKPSRDMITSMQQFFGIPEKEEYTEMVHDFLFKIAEFFITFVLRLLAVLPAEGKTLLYTAMDLLVDLNVNPVNEILGKVPALCNLFQHNPLDAFPAPTENMPTEVISGILKSSVGFYSFLIQICWAIGKERQVACFYKAIDNVLNGINSEIQAEGGSISPGQNGMTIAMKKYLSIPSKQLLIARLLRLLEGSESLFTKPRLQADGIFIIPHTNLMSAIAGGCVGMPLISIPLFKYFIQILQTRKDRFSCNTRPLAFLLLRTISTCLSSFLNNLLSIGELDTNSYYINVIKPLSYCAKIISRMLLTWEPPFSIISLYNDTTFHSLFKYFLIHVAQIPVKQLATKPEPTKNITRALELLSITIPTAFGRLEMEYIKRFWEMISFFIDIQQDEIQNSVLKCIEYIITFINKSDVTAGAMKKNNEELFLHLMSEDAIQADDVVFAQTIKEAIMTSAFPPQVVLDRLIDALVYEEHSQPVGFIQPIPSLIIFCGRENFLNRLITRMSQGKSSENATHICTVVNSAFRDIEIEMTDRCKSIINHSLETIKKNLQSVTN